MTNKMISLLLLVLFGAMIKNSVDACSCLPSHPQDQYCKSDFVIVARIRREFSTNQFNKIYKVKIRKEFKVSEKARIALKSGRLITAIHSAMCGSELEVGKVYLITGRVQGLQAHINFCGFQQQWKYVTSRQRKGFRLIYGRGCDCKISLYHHNQVLKDRCLLSNYKCQTNHGICLRSPSGQCHWSKSIDLKRCLTGDLYPDIIREHSATDLGKYYYKQRKTDDIKKS